MTKGSGTRSGLLWEVERLLNECEELPQVLLMENVPQVHSKGKNMADFQKWIDFLESKGYSNFWQDLNAKTYANVAQNRNRCFMVSVLGNYTYEFPKPIELTKRMKDYLEESVDEKYYINTEKARQLVEKLIIDGKIPFERVVGGVQCDTFHYPHGWLGLNADSSGVCPTIDSGIWKHHTLLIERKEQ